MAVQKMIDTLKNSSFFSDLPDDQLSHLAEIGREIEFKERVEIFNEDEPAKEVYLIVSGKVALVICVTGLGCRQIMEVQDGDLIGWSPCWDRPSSLTRLVR